MSEDFTSNSLFRDSIRVSCPIRAMASVVVPLFAPSSTWPRSRSYTEKKKWSSTTGSSSSLVKKLKFSCTEVPTFTTIRMNPDMVSSLVLWPVLV